MPSQARSSSMALANSSVERSRSVSSRRSRKRPPCAPREQSVQQRRTGVADMEIPRGRGREADERGGCHACPSTASTRTVGTGFREDRGRSHMIGAAVALAAMSSARARLQSGPNTIATRTNSGPDRMSSRGKVAADLRFALYSGSGGHGLDLSLSLVPVSDGAWTLRETGPAVGAEACSVFRPHGPSKPDKSKLIHRGLQVSLLSR